MMKIKAPDQCEFDVVSLGEVMLRLDPGESRIRAARQFNIWEGGGEYNVARSLSAVFAQRTGLLTGLPDHELGRLAEGLIRSSGVDTSMIHWSPYDGVGEAGRLGLNFTERGFGVRSALGISDRAHTVASQIRAEDFDLEDLFVRRGVRWLHTGGIFAALSPQAAHLAEDVMALAREHSTVVSYDLNYRESLWRRFGGQPAAQGVNQRLAPLVDVMLGNEEDFSAALGMTAEGIGPDLDDLPLPAFTALIEQVGVTYPNIQMVATTLRRVVTATVNDWGAIAWQRGVGFVEAEQRCGLEILDRVGGGDSFAAGMIYGLLKGMDIDKAVRYGTAHGALAMTTPGDVSQADLTQVSRLVDGGNARVIR
ncbi:MAG: sugar kinase [Propionibacteriaceae bacterium]|nr:sugar kinase [Propionibacteriaceae bacterium]